MTKAIIFDLGGVLVDLESDLCIEAFHKIGFFKVDEMLDRCHQKGYFNELECGNMTEDEFCDAIIKDSYPGTTREDVKAAFCAFLPGIADYKSRLLEELSAEGYKLYILSNNNPITMAYTAELFKKTGVDMYGIFDDVVYSSKVKLLKPGQEIFKYTISLTGCKPEEILFVDDSMTNVEAGRLAGMKAVHYDITTNLRDTVIPQIER